jgi:4-hydroxy-tetrahydrodipicolinate reductase
MLTTLHAGLGTIGREILKATVMGGVARVVGGVDPLFAGQTLSDLPDIPTVAGPIFGSLAEALAVKPDVALLSTLSTVPAVADDLRALITAGVNVVSTCEDLSYPWLKTPELADELDALARQHGVTVVGTGVNPGFVLDALPVLLTRPCEIVHRVRATRLVNTARRRKQLQLKTGGGLSVAEFRAQAQAGKLGHVGLAESAALIARGLRWEINAAQIAETIEPVLTDATVRTEYVTAGPEQCKGQQQTVTVQGEGERRIELTLRMELGAAEEYDEIIIEGEPGLHARIIGGVFGDSATAGCTVNLIRQTAGARPGLLTVLDLPLM